VLAITKLTFADRIVMSALPLKADMCGATRDVRYGPIADKSAARGKLRVSKGTKSDSGPFSCNQTKARHLLRVVASFSSDVDQQCGGAS
jgi:hypothetical protein